jgi:hypothetical protein
MTNRAAPARDRASNERTLAELSLTRSVFSERSSGGGLVGGLADGSAGEEWLMVGHYITGGTLRHIARILGLLSAFFCPHFKFAQPEQVC